MKYLFRDPTLESLLSIVIVTSAVNSSLTALIGRAIIGKWFDAKSTNWNLDDSNQVNWKTLLTRVVILTPLIIYQS